MNDKIYILGWSNTLTIVEALLCLVLPQQAIKKKHSKLLYNQAT